MGRVSDGLAILGGADLDVLKHAKSERSTFVGLGLVMLGAASVATLSMTFALYNAVLVVMDPSTGGPAEHQPVSHLVLSIALGLVWGALILVLDRALIKTMQGVAGVQALVYAIPRFILAIIIGVVVSTPITLQIFSSEIAAQVKEDQDAEIDAMRSSAADSQTAKDLAEVRGMIVEKEGILKGQVSGLSSPELDQARTKHDNAVTAREQAEKDRDRAHLVMICEKEGAGANPQCLGLASQRAGEGPLFAARQREYNQAVTKVNAAQTAEQTALREMEAAQKTANEANQDIVDAQQAQANLDLCGAAKDEDGETISPPRPDPACQGGLRAQEEQLQTKLAAMENGDLIRNRGGLLAQIVALGAITAKHGVAGTAHLFVALLFMVVELLPVIIKTFIAVRGVTQYDRIARRLQDHEYGQVQTDTDQEQEQRDRETRKTKAIRDDMLDREVKLGKTANKHVADEMTTILDHALAEWSAQVKATLAANPASQGTNQPSSGQTSNPYGLPDGRDI